MEDRVLTLERAITKLVVIQEEQTKQTDKLISSVTDLSAMLILVEQNTKDINELGSKVNAINLDIYSKESAMKLQIETNRKELDAMGNGRLWKGLTTGLAALVFAFGYLYTDIKVIRASYLSTIVHQTKVVNFMDSVEDDITSIVSDLKEIKRLKRRNQ